MSSPNTVQFPVDGQLLRVLPRAGSSLRHPDVQLPTLRSDKSGYYLEMRIEGSEDTDEIAVTRRIPLDDLSADEWEELQQQYENFDFNSCINDGLNKGLSKIQDRKIQRLFMALLTFLNPRQVAIVLYLYREAAQQKTGPTVSFRSNDLLESLGYKRTKDGGFAAKLRSQLHRDLVSLHRTELVYAQSLKKGKKRGAKVVIKSVLRIRDFEIDNVPRDFDIAKAADYTYELADSYTIALEFFDGPRSGDYVLFANGMDFKQKLGSNSKNDYPTKLLVYLASRIRWDKLDENDCLYVSKPYLFKNLDLLGSNASRNNQIFWRTVNELVDGEYLHSAQEMPGDGKQASIQFRINTAKLR